MNIKRGAKYTVIKGWRELKLIEEEEKKKIIK